MLSMGFKLTRSFLINCGALDKAKTSSWLMDSVWLYINWKQFVQLFFLAGQVSVSVATQFSFSRHISDHSMTQKRHMSGKNICNRCVNTVMPF